MRTPTREERRRSHGSQRGDSGLVTLPTRRTGSSTSLTTFSPSITDYFAGNEQHEFVKSYQDIPPTTTVRARPGADNMSTALLTQMVAPTGWLPWRSAPRMRALSSDSWP